MYANCVIEYPIKTLDKEFTYLIPDSLKPLLKVGMKVLVPFNNRLVNGIVLNITNTYNQEYELKSIARIVDPFLVLNQELLSLGTYLKELTLCNLITAFQTMLPSALKIKDQKSDYHKYETYISIAKEPKIILEYINNHRGKKVTILETLLNNSKVNIKEFDRTSIRELEKLSLIKLEKVPIYRLNNSKEVLTPPNLNTYQQAIFNKITNSLNTNQTFLIHGITGSGKTLIYIHLILAVLKQNKEALLLVPEISLTEQIINIFYSYFKNDVAILHSGLSKTEKYDEYLKILNHDVHIVIGTRSAIFAPLTNLGLIIIDEEHSDTYKQDTTPRYHARDIALKRCEYYHIPLVLGSATPSLETMARAKKGVYELLTLNNRFNNAILPKTYIVDMKEEYEKRNFILSSLLKTKITEALKREEQVLLLLNRRGFSTVITCSNCGFTYKCPHCEISLTYHKSSNTLRCHYCGYTKIKDDICPNCHEQALNYLGLGTEKLESIILKEYPSARIIRMDADTTQTKGSHDKIITSFKNHEYDILIGTQMISKGLDFPNCTLVGIINADTSLNIPDFRSGEKTFALLTQCSGRAGRSNKPGEVVIQTFNPDSPIIKCVMTSDYNSFYNYEMPIRKILKYPPYYYLVNILICSKIYEEASCSSTKVYNYLKRNLPSQTIILGPSTALNFKLKNIYRFSITIKYQKDPYLKKVLKELDDIFSTNKSVFLNIDLNPL